MPTYYIAPYGNNANNGTTAATPWATVQFALGAASGTNPGLTAGDTVWIAPGTYREVITSTTLTGTAGNTIKIYGDPKFTQAWTAGSAGPVRLTSHITDTALPTASQTLAIIGDYVDIQDLCIDGNPVSITAANVPAQTCFFIRGGNNSVTRCAVQTQSGNRQAAFQLYLLAGKKTCVISQSTFLSPVGVWIASAAQSNPFDIDVTIKDCLIQSGGGDNAVILECATASIVGIRMYNNIVIGASVAAIGFYNHSVTSATTTVLQNNLIYCFRAGAVQSSGTSITITQSNNVIYGTTTFTNILPATAVAAPAMFDFGASRVQQFSTLPFFAQMTGSPLISAGSATGAPTVDLYGNTWTSTPTIGAIESKVETANPVYQPTERNASTITIAPGSTSQSIELYLGATGLTASTSGLSARYNRTRTASVSIPLVARTIAQAWTSGGFAEVDATNMPGVYRIDIPDAALAAGADDATIVVRGASGTNGAVMTVKLSSGGLTSAQTASAVWDAATASYTNNGSFGLNVLRADQQNKAGNVTLHSSGNVNRVDADVHAIANDTDAATELKGALLHNGTDYISADLLTPVSAATSVHIGPYQLLADGLGADQPLDVNVGTATSIDVQVTDANGTGIDITGATVSAKVYNSGGTLVATYAGTATYADNGRLTFGLTTTVTATSGTYTVTVTRTTGATDTQIFGPLRLYVRPV